MKNRADDEEFDNEAVNVAEMSNEDKEVDNEDFVNLCEVNMMNKTEVECESLQCDTSVSETVLDSDDSSNSVSILYSC